MKLESTWSSWSPFLDLSLNPTPSCPSSPITERQDGGIEAIERIPIVFPFYLTTISMFASLVRRTNKLPIQLRMVQSIPTLRICIFRRHKLARGTVINSM